MGYWVAAYMVIQIIDSLLRKGEYNVHVWNTPEKLPHGWAASISFVLGLVGAVLGMAQVWFIGPIGAQFPPYGGDLGPELAFVFAGTSYLILRPLERKYGKRD